MKKTIYFLSVIILFSCGKKPVENKHIVNGIKSFSKKEIKVDNKVLIDSSNVDYATFYVVVADTSQNYYILQKKMLKLSSLMKLEIDTMGRYFNKEKNKISLPDNAEDELYAGDYYPRRMPSESLSLEYLVLYQRKSRENTIALVTGIFDSESRADSALKVVKKYEFKSFKIKSEMYVGCLH